MELASLVPRLRQVSTRTCYFYTVLGLSAIGLTAIVVGFIGLGLYVATIRNYNTYIATTCRVIDHEYDNCARGNYISATVCYVVTWSVEYSVVKAAADQFMFSTITEIHDKSSEALERLQTFPDNTNHTCYYQDSSTSSVQWKPPQSPTPFLIMMIVGFSVAGLYFVVIGIMAIYRCRQRRK